MACNGKNPKKPGKREKKCKIISVGPPFFCKTASIFGQKQALPGRIVCKLLVSNIFRSTRRFLNVFGGIEMARSAMCDKNSFVNPKGIGSLSPGLARFREGLPWVAAFNFQNPERVEYQRLAKQMQPLRGCDSSLSSPRVARGAQPWAESFNPVGIEKPMPRPQTSLPIFH